jgi:uncharacterized protein
VIRLRAAVRAAVFVALGAAVLAAPALADRYDEQIPEKPKRYVTDRAGVLGSGQAEALNARLEQFERDTSDQILVWVDRKLPEGFTLEDFTVRAAQKWGAGHKKEDNGAVLFVFTEDRKVRIEVGYGLEGALPDITAKQIIDGEIVPPFRSGDYAGGVAAGAAAMMAAVKGEYKGTGRTVNEGRRGREGEQFGNCLTAAIFLGIFVVLPILFRRNRFRSHGGGGWWGGFGGFGGGGFGGGGFGGGGGGFSGGGFSGGGGSFGGGGASGSW